MNPNKVKEILKSLVNELNLPIYIFDGGLIVIIGPGDSLTRTRAQDVVKHWANKYNRSWAISVGSTIAEIEKATTRLALDTHRSTEAKEILASLIAEQTLPFEVVDSGYKLEILIDNGIDYRNEDMIQLEVMLANEGIDVPVRHHGFCLSHKECDTELLFSDVATLTNHLSSLVAEHGLQAKLLHKGFRLQKNQDDEIDIAEAKELTFRLQTMVGIPYVQGGYSYSNDVQDPKIHWHSADMNSVI